MNETLPDRVMAEIRAHEAKQGMFDIADSLTAEARDALIEKLKDGKTVGRCNLADLIDCELNSDRYRLTRDELVQLVLGAAGETRDYRADQIQQGLCERYLDSHPDLIEEEAVEIANAQDE